jgi:hypothetical protein
MSAKLDAMVRYSTSRTTCRQLTIRRYFGEDTTEACGVCDICDPMLARPWLDVPLDEVPVPARLLDPEVVSLYAIDWNAAEVSAGRAPYGRTALEHLLAGDAFSLGRYLNGAERSRRIRRAQASPYWGALQLLTNPAPKITATISMLLDGAAVTEATYTSRGGWGDGPLEYPYLTLTDLGRRRLNQGMPTS